MYYIIFKPPSHTTNVEGFMDALKQRLIDGIKSEDGEHKPFNLKLHCQYQVREGTRVPVNHVQSFNYDPNVTIKSLIKKVRNMPHWELQAIEQLTVQVRDDCSSWLNSI